MDCRFYDPARISWSMLRLQLAKISKAQSTATEW
jgi:hypothetical protein